MMKKILWALAIAIIPVSVWLFTLFYEKYEYEVTTSYSREARVNPFLAAHYFLETNNVKVLSATDKFDFSLISTQDMVFLSNVDDMLLSNNQINEAMNWIAAGGYLIVGVGQEIEGHASILKRFDIEAVEHSGPLMDLVDGAASGKTVSEGLREANKRIEERDKSETEQADNGEDEIDPFDIEGILDSVNERFYYVNLSDKNDRAELQVLDRIILKQPDLDGHYYDSSSQNTVDNDYQPDPYQGSEFLNDTHNNDEDIDAGDGHDRVNSYQEPEITPSAPSFYYSINAHAADEEGTRLIQFHYGEGTFTALSSAKMWRNHNIDDADHAYFLSYLVPEGVTIHWFYNVISPSLWSILKHYFGELIVALLAMLALWLWRSGIRIQGVNETNTSQRRVFAEHLSASAEFLVANAEYSTLIAPIVDDIEARMRHYYPNFSRLAQQQQLPLLALRAEVPKETITLWFDSINGISSQDELIAALKLGSAIRKKL